MTDQIRIAHAAGSRKDRLSSSGAKSDDTLGRKERGDRKAASFFVTRPLVS